MNEIWINILIIFLCLETIITTTPPPSVTSNINTASMHIYHIYSIKNIHIKIFI